MKITIFQSPVFSNSTCRLFQSSMARSPAPMDLPFPWAAPSLAAAIMPGPPPLHGPSTEIYPSGMVKLVNLGANFYGGSYSG